MDSIEKAIAYCNMEIYKCDTWIRQAQNTEFDGKESYIAEKTNVRDNFDIIMSVLREKREMEKGCEMCIGTDIKAELWTDYKAKREVEVWENYRPKRCPECGRKLQTENTGTGGEKE